MVAVDLAMLLGAVDATIVGTAMPTVISSLGGMSLYSWVFSVYVLASTTAIPIFGKLSDLYGRRALFLIGIGTFVGASALCGTATSMTQLIAFRALQGIGAGGIFSNAIAIFGVIFPPHQRGKMQALISAVWGLASIVGPVTGGFIVDHWGWRWTFYISVPIGLAAALMVMAALPESRGAARAGLDFGGILALCTAVITLLFGFLYSGEGHSLLSVPVLGLFAASGLASAWFVRQEKRSKEPILPSEFFSNRLFSVFAGLSLLSGAAMFGAIVFVPLFVQGVLGGSATTAGSVLTPMSLGWVSGSLVGGRLVYRAGPRRMVLAGMVLMSAAYLLLAQVGAGASYFAVTFHVFVLGAGMGVVTVSIVVGIQNNVGIHSMGSASSVPVLFRNVGASIGMALMGSLFTGRMMQRGSGNPEPGLRFPDPKLLLDPVQRGLMEPEVLWSMRVTMASALEAAFWLGFALALVGVVLSLWIPPQRTETPKPET